MEIIQPKYRFRFGPDIPAIVVEIVDQDRGIYLCVYRQGKTKLVSDEFTFDGKEWRLPEVPCGRVLGNSERRPFLDLLEN